MALVYIFGFSFLFFDPESLIAHQRQTENNLKLDQRASFHSGIFTATWKPPRALKESIGAIQQHQSLPITHQVMFFPDPLKCTNVISVTHPLVDDVHNHLLREAGILNICMAFLSCLCTNVPWLCMCNMV